MAVSWAIGAATVAEVDQYNIHQATLLAMRRIRSDNSFL
jgi:ribonuclease HII